MRLGLALASLGALAGVTAVYLAACTVDGVTPDCSNAAVCAPNQGDAMASTDAPLEGSALGDGEAADAADGGPDADASGADADAADADGG